MPRFAGFRWVAPWVLVGSLGCASAREPRNEVDGQTGGPSSSSGRGAAGSSSVSDGLQSTGASAGVGGSEHGKISKHFEHPALPTDDDDAGTATATDGGDGVDASDVGDGGALSACIPERCAAGSVLCGSFCLDPLNDEQHCGASAGCGVAGGSAGASCSEGSRCIQGVCSADCVKPMLPPALYATGDGPYDSAVSDLNGDGRLDVVTANASQSTVSVLLGNGDGTLQAKLDFATDSRPISVAAADLDGDGNTDLVTANYDAQSLSVLLGKGDGTFEPQVSTGSLVDWLPTFVALGDVDGDCRQDAVIAGSFAMGPTHLGVARGNGDGTFAAFTDTGIAASVSTLADLNGDGALDLACTNGLSGLQLALGHGDGTFGLPSTYAAGDQPRWISVGDMNGDGVPDLVAGNANSHDVSVLRGNGDGTFQAALSYAVEQQSPSELGLGDLNGDGTLDVAVVSSTTGYLATLFNDGAGALSPGPRHPIGTARSPAVGDLNADGRIDVVVPISSVDAVGVLLGGGTADFADANTFPAAKFAEGMIAVDLDGKNGPDLVQADYNGQRIGVLLGKGDGTFQPMASVATGVKHYHVVAGDLDGDGDPDLVTTHGPAVGMTVQLNKGDGTFQASPDPLAGVFARDLAVAMLDGDTVPDLVVSGGATGNDSNLYVLLGKGDGTFQPPAVIAVGGAATSSVCIADVNGDAVQDVITTVIRNAPGVGPGFVAVLLGNGDGTLKPQVTLLAGSEPDGCEVADLNEDGHPDLIVNSYVYGQMSVLLGTGGSNGDPLFLPAVALGAGSQSSQFVFADADADGHLDAIVSGGLANDVHVHFGNGQGQLSRAVSYSVGTYPTTVAAADFDGDGHLDLATGNTQSSDVSLLLGKTVCSGP